MAKVVQDFRQSLVEALAQSSLLRFMGQDNANTKTLRGMLKTAEVVAFKEGRVIIHEGHRSDRMYFLTSGEVEISRGGKRICTLARLGDVFGEFGVITGELRSATVTALMPVTCLATNTVFLSKLTQEAKIHFTNQMQQALSKLLMERLQRTGEDLIETRQDLEKARECEESLKRKNIALGRKYESLLLENKRLRGQDRDRLRGPRGDHPKNGEEKH